MNYFNQVILYLDGKKTIILSCVAVVLPILMQAGIVDNTVGSVVLAILGVLGFGAKIYTNNQVESNTELGFAIQAKRK